MKKQILNMNVKQNFLAAASLLAVSFGLSQTANAATAQVTQMKAGVGEADGNVKNLSAEDGKSVKLYTSRKGDLDVIFQVPTASLAGSLNVQASFKQKGSSDQFSLMAKKADGTYQSLGVLSGAKQKKSFKFALPAAGIVNKSVILRLVSTSGADDAQLDALFVADGGGGTTTPTTPTPAPTPTPVPPTTPGTVGKIPVGSTWYWQLSGSVKTNQNAKVYDIDLEDNSAATFASLKSSGKTVICYFSAGTYENWRSDANQFPAASKGSAVEGWAGENWIDVRNETVRQIMVKRLELAKSKGCDGVEPDNVDGYDNKNGLGLTKADQVNYLNFLANEAHKRGLMIGLKNASGLVSSLVTNFDFAVVEECFKYDECGDYAAFAKAGKAVLNAEYTSYSGSTCSQAKSLGFSTVFFNLDLNGNKYEPCQ